MKNSEFSKLPKDLTTSPANITRISKGWHPLLLGSSQIHKTPAGRSLVKGEDDFVMYEVGRCVPSQSLSSDSASLQVWRCSKQTDDVVT